MHIAVVCSSQDPAGANMYAHLKGAPIFNTQNASLHYIDSNPIDELSIPEADLILYATKHESKSQIPSLSTHAPGNWHQADLGGQPSTLGIWPAAVTYAVLHRLHLQPFDLDVVYEATHHGPTHDTPCCFIEIGSTQDYWQRNDIGQFMAEVITATMQEFLENDLTSNIDKVPVAIGIGGLHTAPRFTKKALEQKYMVGHICPHYQLEHLTVPFILTAMQRCIPQATHLLVDWKGLKQHKKHVVSLLKELEGHPDVTIVKIK